MVNDPTRTASNVTIDAGGVGVLGAFSNLLRHQKEDLTPPSSLFDRVLESGTTFEVQREKRS